MMESHACRVFLFLDDPRKYWGCSLLEIFVAGGVFFVSFLLDHLAIGFFLGSFCFKLTRTISQSSKVMEWKRWLYFQLEEMHMVPGPCGRFYL
jgi:hypothetical protein